MISVNKKAVIISAFLILATIVLQLNINLAFADEKITICHGTGHDDTTHFVTLTLSRNAVYQDHGEGGHFYENGTPKAGHEQDYLGECRVTESPEPSADPTTTPTPTATPVSSSTPAPESSNQSTPTNDNGQDNNQQSSNAIANGEVLGAMAETGVAENTIMDAIALIGGLMTSGSIFYGKNKKN